MRKTIIIAIIGILSVIASQTQAALIEIAIEAEITDVSDDYNLLEGNVNVGDTITGSYKYDSETPDSSPTDPVQGNYWHYSAPYGVSLSVSGFEFKTNSNAINFLMYVRNNLPLGYDRYGFSSNSNSSLVDGTPIRTIGWLIEDSTETAIPNDNLPTTAPILINWQDENLLVIAGGIEREETFGISATVTSATLIPEPTSLLFLLSGLIYIRKRK